MRILLDECVNPRVKAAFHGHQVSTVVERGWGGLRNGELLALAQEEFEAFVTIDQSIEYQHDLKKLKLGLLVVHVPDKDQLLQTDLRRNSRNCRSYWAWRSPPRDDAAMTTYILGAGASVHAGYPLIAML